MKDHAHLTPAQIETLLSGKLSPEAIRLGVRVLLAGCPECMETVRLAVLRPGGPGGEDRRETRKKPIA